MEISGKIGKCQSQGRTWEREKERERGKRQDKNPRLVPNCPKSKKGKKKRRKKGPQNFGLYNYCMAMEVDLQEVQSVPKVQEYMLLPMF